MTVKFDPTTIEMACRRILAENKEGGLYGPLSGSGTDLTANAVKIHNAQQKAFLKCLDDIISWKQYVSKNKS